MRKTLWLIVSAMAVFSAATALYIYKEYVLGTMCLLGDIWLIIKILRIIANVDSDLSLLIEAMKNSDSTLRYPVNRYFGRVGEKINQIAAMLHSISTKAAEEQHYFSIIINHVQAGILVVDSKGNVINSNKAAHSLLNMEVISCVDRIADAAPQLAQSMRDMRSKDVAIVKLPGKELSLTCSEFSFTFHGQVKLFVLTEISAALNKKEQETWSLSVRTLSHEIMNSLAPIISISQTLRDLPPDRLDASLIQEGLGTISSMSENLVAFAQNYRALAMMPAPQITRQLLLPMVKEVVEIATLWQHSSAPISFDVSIDSSVAVDCDRQLTVRAISNVVKNAVEALADTPNPLIVFAVRRPQPDFILLTISNNGPQIPASCHADIFTPFFTTRKGGQGIGLSLSKRIMSAQNGAMFLNPYTSTTSLTTFSFRFPSA